MYYETPSRRMYVKMALHVYVYIRIFLSTQ